jgi:hypothetical protein
MEPKRDKIIDRVNIEELIRGELSPSETLISTLYCMYTVKRPDGITVQFPAKVCCFGLSDRRIVCILRDLLGKNVRTIDFPLNQIASVKYSKGFTGDQIQINYKSQVDPLILKVSRRFRRNSNRIVEFILSEIRNKEHKSDKENILLRQNQSLLRSKWEQLISIETYGLMLVLLGLIAFITLFSLVVEQYIYGGDLPVNYANLTASSILFLFGLIGMLFIVKKEMPPLTFISIKGHPAILIGLFIVILFWGLIILNIVKNLTN